MAKRYVDTLFEHERNNKQVGALKSMVEDKIQKETLKGVVVAGGVLAGAVAVASFFLRNKRR
ncbi:HLJ1_G0053440.mRNA.1.CDS.1 [Saccharomyces cerevisiae]|nr:HLJ1_G0053440.mRNA.1.CDS.1 [Saccharomyces cerevisiae]